jgi:hypothetical protein
MRSVVNRNVGMRRIPGISPLMTNSNRDVSMKTICFVFSIQYDFLFNGDNFNNNNNNILFISKFDLPEI